MALEIALAVLLVACLFYCWRLDRKLSALRKGEAGLRAAAAELTQAVTQAESAIKTLRAVAQESHREVTARPDPNRTALDRRVQDRAIREPSRRSAL